MGIKIGGSRIGDVNLSSVTNAAKAAAGQIGKYLVTVGQKPTEKPGKPVWKLGPIEIPRLELPKIELPKFKLPKISLPKLELPKIELPKFKLPKIELPKITARDIYEVADNIDKILFPASLVPAPGLQSARGIVNGVIDLVNTVAGKPLIPRNVNDAFLADTKDFRTQTANVRRLQEELQRLEAAGASPAEIQAARARLAAASNRLQSSYGYTAETMPKPGQLWIDPQFLHRDLPDGKVTAAHFPTTGTPVDRPPRAEDFMFSPYGQDRNIGIKNADGTFTTVTNPDEYRALVAENRTALGLPANNGEPVSVHLALEGGGGKGKRYPAAFNEMYKLGIVPTSFSGTSAGSIMAAMLAAGADPQRADAILNDPKLGQLYDINLRKLEGGVMDGNAAFDFIDQKLRELTGITDRPVTFADLKAPLQVVAFKLSDTGMPERSPEWSKPENRIFVFSQETTPNVPVALAVRASMAIPFAFDPVEMIDPTTGRKIQLVDGGVYDNLPVGYNKNDLPTIAMNLADKGSLHPKDNVDKSKPLPDRQINPYDPIDAGTALYDIYIKNKNNGDYRDTTSPAPNTFALSLPTWDLTNPKRGNDLFGFGYNEVDRILDPQTAQVTRDFFKQFFTQIGQPGASGTNLKPMPQQVSFNTTVRVGNTDYTAKYNPGDSYVTFTDPNGRSDRVYLGQKEIEKMYLDHLAFGDLSSQLSSAYRDYLLVKYSRL